MWSLKNVKKRNAVSKEALHVVRSGARSLQLVHGRVGHGLSPEVPAALLQLPVLWLLDLHYDAYYNASLGSECLCNPRRFRTIYALNTTDAESVLTAFMDTVSRTVTHGLAEEHIGGSGCHSRPRLRQHNW